MSLLSRGFYSKLIDKLISIALPKILLTACANQLLYKLSLIEFCVACEKQNAAVKTASDACLLLENRDYLI